MSKARENADKLRDGDKGDVIVAGPSWTLDPNAIPDQVSPANTIRGNDTGDTAATANLTPAQVTALLPPANALTKGLVPASGGGTANYLRADFSWTAPPDTGEANTASNLGAGTGLFSAKSGVDLQFKSLVAGTNVTFSSDANTVTINATGSGGGGSGDVVGPASATANAVAVFDGTTGKLLADSTKVLPTGALVGTSDTQTLTNKTLTSPTIDGGAATALTTLAVRNAGAGTFDMTVAHNGTLTAGRALTWNLNDAARSVSLSGDLALANNFATSGNFALTLTQTGTTNVTLPTTGTLATLAGTETLTNKTLTDPTMTGGTVDTFPIGYRNVPQNSQSAAYTLVLADAGKHIFHPSADTTARTFTIPANSSVAYPIGTAITFVNQNGAGVITIAITTDTLRLAGAGTTGSRTLAANGVATALKVTSTEWIISGTGLT
jgi:hypothetical protein